MFVWDFFLFLIINDCGQGVEKHVLLLFWRKLNLFDSNYQNENYNNILILRFTSMNLSYRFSRKCPNDVSVYNYAHLYIHINATVLTQKNVRVIQKVYEYEIS